MTVRSMLFALKLKGYDVSEAFAMCDERILNLPVEKNKRYKTVAGRALRDKIVLAARLWEVPGNAWDAIHSTFMHELAHVLAPWHGHSDVWKQIAIRLGDDGERCHNYENMARKPRPRKAVAACIPCEKVWYRKKRLNKNRTFHCPICGGEVGQIED